MSDQISPSGALRAKITPSPPTPKLRLHSLEINRDGWEREAQYEKFNMMTIEKNNENGQSNSSIKCMVFIRTNERVQGSTKPVVVSMTSK